VIGVALASTGPAAARDEGPGALPWRVGHEVGFSVDAAAFPESAGTSLEVYVRIRPSLIADLCRDGREPSPIRLQATLKPLFGGGHSTSREQTFVVNVADTADALGEVVVLSFPVRAGRHRLGLRMDTRRRNLARAGVEKPEVARVEGELVVPAAQASRQISDLEFIWGETGRRGSRVFGRSGRDLIPNPERLYGLYANSMRAFFSARAETARPWQWVARAIDSAGVVVAEQAGRGDAAVTLQSEVSLDVSGLPAGAYDLEVKAWQEGDEGAVLRRSRFSVAWRADSWKRDPQALADDVHFLFTADQEELFPTLTPGEQERAIDSFWARRDPTPDTGENEARTQYYRRVRFANLTYGRYGLGRGMFSDMGRAYIRYGEPAEVVRQVMPSLDDNLARIIQELAQSEPRTLGAVQSRELGTDTRPFELWVYEGSIPLPIDADPSQSRTHTAGSRLVFLFVDQHWTGDYRLLYSSE
ncbi:MAG: GWxTD domain-containing protein, partial [Candidatus Eisenbacteria bacterium]